MAADSLFEPQLLDLALRQVIEAGQQVASETCPSGGIESERRATWWAMLDLNQRLPACKAGALPLS